MPKLTAVDFNPFEQAGPALTPVDYDPFASTEPEKASLWDHVKAGARELGAAMEFSSATRKGELLGDQRVADSGSGVLGFRGGDFSTLANIAGGRDELVAEQARQGIEQANQTVAETGGVRFSPSVERMMTAGSFGEAWDAFLESPVRAIAEVGARSSVNSVASLPGAVAGGLVGGPIGFAAGMGLGSGGMESMRSIREGMEREGVDTSDPHAVLEATKNRELMGRVRQYAGTRGAVIGAFDVASGGLATKTLAPSIIGGQVARQLTNVGAQAVAQAGMGAGGEAAAQMVTDGEIRAGEVFAEGVGEMISAPVDIASAAMTLKRGEQGEGGPVDYEQRLANLEALYHQAAAEGDEAVAQAAAQRHQALLDEYVAARQGDNAFTPPDPLTAATQAIDRAGEEVAAQGGDALDAEMAKADAAGEVLPSAVQQSIQRRPLFDPAVTAPEQDVTGADLGIAFPEQSAPVSAERLPLDQPRDMSGIDGLIAVANRMGFTDEVARLTGAKRLYATAERLQAEGKSEQAAQRRAKADSIYQEVTEGPAREYANQFPAPYAYQGEIAGGEVTLSTAPNFVMGESVEIDGQAQQVENRIGFDSRRIGSEGMIYGERPEPQRQPLPDTHEGVGRNVIERMSRQPVGIGQDPGVQARGVSAQQVRQAAQQEVTDGPVRYERTPSAENFAPNPAGVETRRPATESVVEDGRGSDPVLPQQQRGETVPDAAPAADAQPALSSANQAEPAAEVAAAAPHENSASSPTEREVITDLGEKIGGARKDAATRMGRTDRSRSADDRPTWARRFEVAEIVASSDPSDKGRWSVTDTRLKDRLGQPKRVGQYDSEEEARAAIPLLALGQKHRPYRNSQGQYEIWRNINDRKRVKVVDQQFESREAAMRHMVEHATEILETNTTFGEADLPRPENTQRIGEARRTGDVSGQDFMSVFGLRAVEFGNWNNQAERQEVMNEAYDGLLDLAEALDLPPAAIGLNGDLALAFGARGQGLNSARAHYERTKAVINLTKMNGAGALAHEWFHAMDHYFGRQDGKASAEWSVGQDGTRSLSITGNEMVSSGFSLRNSGVREELRAAYASLMDTIFHKAETYVEDTRKADAFVARARDDLAKKLDALRKDLSEQKDPRYWKRKNKPASAEQLAEFDTIAKQLLAGESLETDARTNERGRSSWSVRWSNDALDRLSAIYKEVRGRSGFDATNQRGVMDSLRQLMGSYSRRLKMLADAQSAEPKQRRTPTEFAMDARELDQGRGKDYWTTPHEMAARAFQGFVEDKIAEQGGRSPFLNHAPESAAIPTPWGWKRPYPHGAERQAINQSFDALIGALEARETESGIALYDQTDGYSSDNAESDYVSDTSDSESSGPLSEGAGRPVPPDRRRSSVQRWRALGISREVEQGAVASLVGRTIGSAGELAELAQVYRNPRYETARFFFTRNRIVVHASAITSRLPGVSAVFPGEGRTFDQGVAWLNEQMSAAGADGYWMLHNHPSGDPTPSDPDLSVTDRIAAAVPGFSGHVVINSNKYAIVLRRGINRVIERQFGEDFLLKASVPSEYLGKKVSGPDAVGVIGKSFQREGWVTLIGAAGTSGVRAIADIPTKIFTTPAKAKAAVRRFARMSGSNQVFAYGESSDLIAGRSEDLVREGFLVDAVSLEGASLNSDGVIAEPGKSFGYKPSGKEVKEAGGGGATPADAAAGKFSPSDSTNFAVPDETLTAVAIRKIQDKFKVLKDLQANIKAAGGKVDNSNDAYLAEELFHGKAENDLRLMQEQYVEPLAKKMADFGITRAELDKYLYAKHAPERNAHIASINPEMQDGGSGMTNAEAADALVGIRASGKQAKYDQLAAIVYDMLKVQRDLIRKGGMEDDGAIDAWEAKYKHYVPLKGWAEDTKDQGRPRTGKGFTIGGKESKRAMGRSTEAASPVSYAIIDLTEKMIRRRKNEVGNALLKLVQDNPSKSYWQVFSDENPDMDRRIVKVKDPATGAMVEQVRETAVPMAMLSDRYFTTKKGGKTYYIKLEDQRLMTAMKNLGPESNGALIRTLSAINRVLSSLNTSYSPEFVISNFARDIQTAILNLSAEQSLDDGKAAGQKIAAKTAKDVPVAMRAIYASLRGKTLEGKGAEWQQMFDQFRRDGAKTGWFDMKDLDGQAKALDRLVGMAQGGIKGNFFKYAHASARFVENLNQSVENAVRLSAYANAVWAGVPRPGAATLAKNLTVNFNRRGEIGTTLNALYMFANASVQGTANFARTMLTFKGDGSPRWRNLNNAQKIAVGIVAGSYFLAMANRMGAGEDDDGENWYDKVPDYVRERNLVIMKSLLGGEPDGSYWKIPLPYGYNAFHVTGNGMEAVLNGNKSPAEASTELVLAVLGSFSPIGFQESATAAGTLVKNAAPTILKPAVDLSMNENFMGSSIYSENFPFGTPKPNSAMARRSTPEGYKQLAEWLNEVSGGSQFRSGAVDVNPDVLRYVVDYFGGSAYSFVGSKVPDAVYRYVHGVEMEPHHVPFLGRISGRVMHYEDMDKFYQRRDEISQIDQEARFLRGPERIEFLRDHRHKLKLRGLVTGTENQLKVLRKHRDRIYEQDLTPAERDKQLKTIEEQMKAAIDRFNKAYATSAESRQAA